MTFREFLSRRSIPFRIRGEEIWICCPFCLDRGESIDTRFRLGINLRKDAGHCFNCNWASWHVQRNLARKFGFLCAGPVEEDLAPSETVLPRLPEDFHLLVSVRDELDERARNYLMQRDVTPEQIRRYGVGVSFCGKYAYRVIFPVWWRKKLYGFVARDFLGNSRNRKRYLYPPGMQKALFAMEPVRQIVLVEGVFKALRLRRYLQCPAAAILGSSLSPFQVEILQTEGCREVILWPDPDAAGARGARASRQILLAAGLVVKIVWPSVAADDAAVESLNQCWAKLQSFDLHVFAKLKLHGGRTCSAENI